MKIILGLVVLLWACIVTSCTHSTKGYEDALLSSNEHQLKTNLSNLREVIQLYTIQKDAPPRALNDLVEAGYINQIPPDPITKKVDWVVVFNDCSKATNCKNGIKDIHSASQNRSTSGSFYKDW